MNDSIALTVTGAPRTKKNHGERWKVPGRGTLTVPSKAWREWCDNASILRNGVKILDAGFKFAKWRTLFRDECLNCRALFFRQIRTGDAVGYYQGLADLLQKRGVVVNDAQIVSWDGSRMLKDSKRPRVELTLEVVAQ